MNQLDSYPKKFDSSNLSIEDRELIASFAKRRRCFDSYLKEKNISLITCPGCGFPTLDERGHYEICSVCDWEDDNQDDMEADEIWGCPNYNLSLTENRLNIGRVLAKLARENNGELVSSPEEAISLLKIRDKVIGEVISKMTKEADINHPIYNEYKEIKQHSLRTLIKKLP